MEHLNKLTAPATVKLRQLQKIVQDIKKNDDSLFNRLKRIKKKGPPKVPTRDYQGEAAESEKYSDSDFASDSDTYEDPQCEHEDNYEPPPRSEAHAVNTFTVAQSITNSRGQYVDSCRGRPAKPNTSFHLVRKNVGVIRKNQADDDDDDENDYVEPEETTDNDNYIDPTGRTPTKPLVNRVTKPTRPNKPDFCGVPEERSQFKMRANTTLQVNTQMTQPKVSPRMQIRKPTMTPQDPDSEDEYEVCDGDDESPEVSTETRRSVPTPRPRDLKKSSPAMMPKPSTPHRDTEGPSIHTARSPPDTTVSPPSTGFHRARMPLPKQISSQSRGTLPSESKAPRDAEEEAGVYNKVWYASSCARRTAEDALIRMGKDGSFLLRKSSGVDAQQPYTLVVFYNGRVYNIPVRYIASSKQFALGKEKQGEDRFCSVSDIVENHQKNPLVLVDSQSNTKDFTKLRYPVKP
nr:B-cell linker protein isoform X6 [Misgurnus anguillicaudatus]